jgi:hypothetical protein
MCDVVMYEQSYHLRCEVCTQNGVTPQTKTERR